MKNKFYIKHFLKKDKIMICKCCGKEIIKEGVIINCYTKSDLNKDPNLLKFLSQLLFIKDPKTCDDGKEWYFGTDPKTMSKIRNFEDTHELIELSLVDNKIFNMLTKIWNYENK